MFQIFFLQLFILLLICDGLKCSFYYIILLDDMFYVSVNSMNISLMKYITVNIFYISVKSMNISLMKYITVNQDNPVMFNLRIYWVQYISVIAAIYMLIFSVIMGVHSKYSYSVI